MDNFNCRLSFDDLDPRLREDDILASLYDFIDFRTIFIYPNWLTSRE